MLFSHSPSQSHIGLFDDMGEVFECVVIKLTFTNGAIGIEETNRTTINDNRRDQKWRLTDNVVTSVGRKGQVLAFS